uniref:Ectopic P granules protein 5 homolog n=1 Tax=Strongyloides papillosus TaxID=174720 RepID=A0A0N5C6W8_STREA
MEIAPKTKKNKTKTREVVEELGPAPLPPRGIQSYGPKAVPENESKVDDSVKQHEVEHENVTASAPVIDEEEYVTEKSPDKVGDRYKPKYNIGYVDNIATTTQLYPQLQNEVISDKIIGNIGFVIDESGIEKTFPYQPKIHEINLYSERRFECNIVNEINYISTAYKDMEILRNRYKIKGIEGIVHLNQHMNKIMDSDMFPHSIYIEDLLKKFREYSVSKINATVDNQMNVLNLQNSEKDVWTEEIINNDVTGVCGHGSKCSGIITFTNFKFQNESYNKFCNVVNETFNHEFNKLYPLEIGCQSLIIQIEWCLHRVMKSFDEEIKMRRVIEHTINEDSNEMNGSIRKEIRKILACLFSQLRKPIVSKEFSEFIKKWIKMTVAILNKCIHVSDQIAIIIHLLRLPGDLYAGATDLIIPCLTNCTFDQSISYFGLLISTLMKAINNREEFLSEVNTSHSDEDDFLVVNEDSNIENPIKLQPLVVSAIFDRFNINDLIGCHQKSFTTRYGDPSFHLSIFTKFSHLIMILSEGLDNYSGKHVFKDFMIRIAHMQKEIICLLYSLYGATQRQENIEYCNLLKADLSKLMVYFFYKIVNTDCPIIGQVLVGLPLDGMFTVDIYKLNFILTKDTRNLDFNQLFEPSISNLMQERRQKKWDNLFLEMNKEITVHDSCYFNALAEVVSHLDFLDLSFVEQILESFMIDSRKRELFSKTGSEMICSMLMNKPECLKRILDFIGRRHADLNSYALDIFRCSNLSGVIPSISIVNQLGKWLLLFDITHPVARVSISLLKSVNWRNCYKNEEFELYDIVGKLLGQLQQTKCSAINKKIAKGSLNLVKQGEHNVYLEFNNFLWDICLRLPQLHVPFPYNDSDDILNTPISHFLHIMRNCMDTMENFKTYGYFYLEELSKQGCHQAIAVIIGRLLYEFNTQVITNLNNKEFMGIFEAMITSNDSYLAFSMIGLGAKFPTNIVHFFRNIVLLYLHLLMTKNSSKTEIYKYLISVIKLMSLRTQVDYYNTMEFTYIFDCFVRYYITIGLNDFSFDDEFQKEIFNIYLDKASDSKKKIESSMFGFMKTYELPPFYTKTPNCDISEFILLSIYTRCSREWQDLFFEYISKGKSLESAISKVKSRLKVDITLFHLSIIQWLQMAVEKSDENVTYPWILQTLLYQIFEYQKFFIILSKNVFVAQLFRNLTELVLPKIIKNTDDKKLKCQYELYLQSFLEKKFIVRGEYSDLHLVNIWKLNDKSQSIMTNIDLKDYVDETSSMFDYSLKRFELNYQNRQVKGNEPKWLKFKNNWIGLFNQYNNYDASHLVVDFSILQFRTSLPTYTFIGSEKQENYVMANNTMFNSSFNNLKNHVHEYFSNKEKIEELLIKYKTLIPQRMQLTSQSIQGLLYCKKQPFKKCDRPVNVTIVVSTHKDVSNIFSQINQIRSQKTSEINCMKSKLFNDIAMNHAQLNDFVLHIYQTINRFKIFNNSDPLCDNLRYIGQNIFERVMCDTLAEEMLFELFNQFVSDAIKYSAEIICTDDRGKQRFQEQLLFFIFGGSGLLNHVLHKIFQPGMFNNQSITTTYQTICEQLNTFGKAYDARQCLLRFSEILSKESEETLYNLIPVIVKFARKCKNCGEGTEEHSLLILFSDHLAIIVRRTLPGSISAIIKDLVNSSDEIIFPDSLGIALYEKLNIPNVLINRDISTVDTSIINELTTLDILNHIKYTCQKKRLYHKEKFFGILKKNICMISDIIRFLTIIMGHHYIRNPLYISKVGEKMLYLLHETWDFLLFPVDSDNRDILVWEVNEQQFGNFVVDVFEKAISDVTYFSFNIVEVTFPKISKMSHGIQQRHITSVLRLAFRQLRWEQYKPSIENYSIFQNMIYNSDHEISGIIGDISVKINWTYVCDDSNCMVCVFKLFYSLSIYPLSSNDIFSSFIRSMRCLLNLPNWYELTSKQFEDISETIFNNASIERYRNFFDKSDTVLYPELLDILKKISQIEVTNDLEEKSQTEFEERVKKISIYVKIMNKLIFSRKKSEGYIVEKEYITLFDNASSWLRKVYEHNNHSCYYGLVATNLIDLSSVQNEDLLKRVLKSVNDYILNYKEIKTKPILPGFQQILITYHSSISLRYEMTLINELFKREYLQKDIYLFPECDIYFVVDDSILSHILQNFGSYNEYTNIEWILGSILDGLIDRQTSNEKHSEFFMSLENYCLRCLKLNAEITIEFCVIIYYYLQNLTIHLQSVDVKSRRLTHLKSTINLLEQFENKFSSNYIISSFSNMFKKFVSTGAENQFPISTFIKGVILFIKNQKLKNDVRLKTSDKIYKSRYTDFQTLLKSNPITYKNKTLDGNTFKEYFTEEKTLFDAPKFYITYYNKIAEFLPPNFNK